MSNELRDRIAERILDNFNPPDERHESWWINHYDSAQAVIDLLELHETAESLSSDMVKYETKWLKRDD